MASTPRARQPSVAPKKTNPATLTPRQGWKRSLPAPWPVQYRFKHPKGTRTVTKTDAKKIFKPRLDDADIATLPCEYEKRPPFKAVQHYAYEKVLDLAQRKALRLGKLLEIDSVNYRSGATQSLKLQPWQEHMLRPQPPPSLLHDYTSPSDAAVPDPVDTTWTPSKISGAVSVEDACRLYCLNPKDIQDLSNVSPWIDLASAAKRALAIHGGYYAHRALVLQHRRQEEEMLSHETQGPVINENTAKSRFRFSKMIQQQWDAPDDSSGMYEGRKRLEHRVAVFYPIQYECMNDYGTEWEWLPSDTDF
ncbi:hypothetical protein C8R47DRAFT_1123579 [Mycena vitilis]|nr:hypothetical protein C8R47DRAFT_1123579 [Mycena vitilis]